MPDHAVLTLPAYADHGFAVLRRSGRDAAEVMVELARTVADCALLMTQAGLTLGQIHESQKEPGEAMNEYQRVVALGGAGKADLRSQAERAVAVTFSEGKKSPMKRLTTSSTFM